MTRLRLSAGYTLVELMVTLGLIAIFLTLFMAVVSGTMKTLKTVEGRTDASQKAWVAMSYLKTQIAAANFYDAGPGGTSSWNLTGHNELGRSGGTAPRADVDPDFALCDTNLDGRIATDDYVDPLSPTPPGPFQPLMDPQCSGLDPDLELLGNLPAAVCPTALNLNPCPPDANINPNDRNPHFDPTGGPPGSGLNRYRMAWEDMNGNGGFDLWESHLRTLIFSTRSPTAAVYLQSSCPTNDASRVERDVVTIAHSWKDKTFWIDDLNSAANAGTVQPNELRTFDFVLYERRTRFYEDANRNLDLNCDGALQFDRTNPAYDERFRTIEIPIAQGIIDVWFRLLNADGNEILPCTNPDVNQGSGRCEILTSVLPSYGHTDPIPLGLFYSNCYIKITGTWYPRACSRLDEIRAVEITVIAGSNDTLTLLRKTRDQFGRILSNLTNTDPRQVGAIDYLQVTPGLTKGFYTPGNLMILKDKVFLPGFALGR